MYTVALLKDKEDSYFVLYDNGKVQKFIAREYENLEFLGYKFVSAVVTTDVTLSLKTRLKYRLVELRHLKPNVNYYGYEESLMMQIGLLTSRLLRRGVEVTDELALQCFDYRQQQRLKENV